MRGPRAAGAAEARATGWLRGGVLGLAAFGVIGAAVDLGLSRHWQSAIQLVPWASLAGLALALALIAASPTGRILWIARGLLMVVAASAALGVYQHVAANYATAPLDFRYAERWEQMSGAARLWAAASQAVGPSPTMVPGLLAYLALMSWLATVRHPAFGSAPQPAAAERLFANERHQLGPRSSAAGSRSAALARWGSRMRLRPRAPREAPGRTAER